MAKSPCAVRVRCRACTALLAMSLLVLIGCSQRENADDHAVRIVPGSGAATSTPTTPYVARVARDARPAISLAVPPASQVAAVHKTFADPPLPPELRDDGGLVPLPPRPDPSATAMPLHPTFDRAAPSATGEEKP